MNLPQASADIGDNSGVSPRIPLSGAVLSAIRTLWITLAIFCLGLFALSIPNHVIYIIKNLSLPELMAMAQLGISANFLIGFEITLSVIIVLWYSAVALAIFLNKTNDWMAVFVSVAMLTFGVTVTEVMNSLVVFHPEWGVPVIMLEAVGLGAILFVLYLFPDGRFVPHWSRTLAYFWIAWLIAFWLFSGSGHDGTVSPVVHFLLRMMAVDPGLITRILSSLRMYSMVIILLFWFGSGAFAQIYRYMRVSSPIQRSQTKWAVLGFTAAIVLYFMFFLLIPVALEMNGQPAIIMLRYNLIAQPIVTLALLLFPLSLAISMLRYRLWDVDFLINRTLVYGVSTSFLGVIYFGSVLLSQLVFRRIAGDQSTLSIAITTLIIASLFRPLRNRIQDVIDRRFYREKVNFRQVFTSFAREVRTIIDLSELLRVLVDRTAELLHIGYGAVFLNGHDQSLVLTHAHKLPQDDLIELPLDSGLLERLKSGQVVSIPKDPLFAMLVPLIAPQPSGQKGNRPPLLGILALGPQRSGLHYSREDQALLVSLAEQAGTAIYVAQLIEETQAETRRREQAEEHLEAHRNSPLGRAEALAQEILGKPETALIRLHRITQEAGKDQDAANLIGNLPKVLDNLGAGPIAGMAEGYNYLFTSQFTPELMPVGLRTLITALSYTQENGAQGSNGNRDVYDGAEEEQTCCEALSVYRLCQAALDANSIAQITALKGLGDLAICPVENSGRPISGFIGDLSQALAEMQSVADAFHAYERVDTVQDKLAYLASAVDRLRHVDHVARTELGSADRSILLRIIENWLGIVTSTMSDLQTSARIVCHLLTRNTWQGDVVSLALGLQNQGRGAALQISVSLAPAPEYTLVDETVTIERLAPGEEAQVQLRVRPRLSQGVSHFRARFVILYTDPRGPDQVENFADVVHLLAADGEFTFIPNPYVVGTPLKIGSPLFFGREDLVRFVHENLSASHRNNLVLIGQRRTGKTSLLKQLPARLDDNYLPVYLDGQTLGLDPGLSNFFLTLATEIAFALEDRGFIIRHPMLEDFHDSPAATFEHTFLGEVRGLIGDRHLLIMFDEFEELESAVKRGNLEASIFGFLRHLIQHSSNLSVIFCGTHRIEELAADYWNVLFNISLYQHIGFLDREEAWRLVQEPVAEYGMRYDDLALDKMWRVTAGHPYFLQLLCHSLVNRHNKTERSYVTIADLNAALDEILASGEAHFVYLWAESSPQERLILTALSRMVHLTGQATVVQLMDFLSERGISIERQTVSEALHHLTLRDILQANREGEYEVGESYRWKLGLLGLWVEKYKSLSRVVDEFHQ